ncbi:MAG: GIY-YIG nuclease family protein [Candidatus Thorarchaeota archaeon]
MDAAMLATDGFFSVADPFDNLEEVPTEPAIYALCLTHKIPRLRRETDIIYIGQTRDLNNRMSEYGGDWKREGGTGWRVCQMLNELSEPIVLLFRLEEGNKNHRIVIKQELLELFETDHLELPALNRRIG